MVCVSPGYWDLQDLAKHTCDGRPHGHVHIGFRNAHLLHEDGILEWIHQPLRRREKGIARWCRRLVPVRGLSCKVGVQLAQAVRRKESWAIAMIQDIRRDGKQLYNGDSRDGNASLSDSGQQGEGR